MAPPPKKSQSERSKQTAIDPRGDVFLQFGSKSQDNDMTVLVSSRALSFLSPVFATMFDGRLGEGQNLSSSTPLQLPLPDDDPVATLALCNIAHLRVPELPSESEYQCFAEFSILCDKYNCADAVRSHSRTWAIELSQAPDHPQFETLVFSTYVLDLHEEFSLVTRAIILQRTTIKVAAILYQTRFLPLFALDHLQKAQRAAMDHANDALLEENLKIVSDGGECDDVAGVHDMVLRFLWVAEIWPPATRSFRTIRSMLANAEPLNIADLTCGRVNCECKDLPAMQFRILEQLMYLEEDTKGLCLDCIKAEDTGVTPEACRMEH